MPGSPLYDVQVWLETVDGPEESVRQVTDALSEVPLGEHVKGRVTVTPTGQGVLVHFDDVAPTRGPKDHPQAHDILPAIHALLSTCIERVAGGATPSQKLMLEVRPAPTHGQEELRHA